MKPNWVKHLKKYSAPIAINDMQIKTTLRFYIAPVTMTKINKMKDSNAGKDARGIFIIC